MFKFKGEKAESLPDLPELRFDLLQEGKEHIIRGYSYFFVGINYFSSIAFFGNNRFFNLAVPVSISYSNNPTFANS